MQSDKIRIDKEGHDLASTKTKSANLRMSKDDYHSSLHSTNTAPVKFSHSDYSEALVKVLNNKESKPINESRQGSDERKISLTDVVEAIVETQNKVRQPSADVSESLDKTTDAINSLHTKLDNMSEKKPDDQGIEAVKAMSSDIISALKDLKEAVLNKSKTEWEFDIKRNKQGVIENITAKEK